MRTIAYWLGTALGFFAIPLAIAGIAIVGIAVMIFALDLWPGLVALLVLAWIAHEWSSG